MTDDKLIERLRLRIANLQREKEYIIGEIIDRKEVEEQQKLNREQSVNEDQQLLDSQSQALIRENYFSSGYIQGLSEALTLLGAKKEGD